MSEIHDVLFNAQILFSLALGLWAAVMAGRNESISGNFWGAVATFAGLVGVTLLVGLILIAQGLRPRDGRLAIYLLYMAFLLVIMPGLFSLLRGRDDRSASVSFAVLAWFNAAVSISMVDREITGPWVEMP
jgi:hypothetical protein